MRACLYGSETMVWKEREVPGLLKFGSMVGVTALALEYIVCSYMEKLRKPLPLPEGWMLLLTGGNGMCCSDSGCLLLVVGTIAKYSR